MLIEYYRKRRAGLPNAIVYLEPRGISFELPFQTPVDVPDEMAYRVLSKFGDICRQVAPVEEPKPRKKKSKKTKDVTDFQTA